MSKALSTVGRIAGVVATIAATVAAFSNPASATAAVAIKIASVAAAASAAPSPGCDLTIGRKPMTALNAFCDNAYAYVATDGVAYNVETGQVHQEVQKAVAFHASGLVLALTGRAYISMMVAALDEVHPEADVATQASILAALPNAVRHLDAALRTRFPADAGTSRNAVEVVAAYFDQAASVPRLARCYSPGTPGCDDRRAFELVPFDGRVMPALTPDQERAVFPLGYFARPVPEIRHILALQRSVRCEAVAGGCAVGGTCYFYRVGRDGVHAHEFHRFPETAGERLNPALAGAPIASPLEEALAI